MNQDLLNPWPVTPLAEAVEEVGEEERHNWRGKKQKPTLTVLKLFIYANELKKLNLKL
jgi:hypothetical protein